MKDLVHRECWGSTVGISWGVIAIPIIMHRIVCPTIILSISDSPRYITDRNRSGCSMGRVKNVRGRMGIGNMSEQGQNFGEIPRLLPHLCAPDLDGMGYPPSRAWGKYQLIQSYSTQRFNGTLGSAWNGPQLIFGCSLRSSRVIIRVTSPRCIAPQTTTCNTCHGHASSREFTELGWLPK